MTSKGKLNSGDMSANFTSTTPPPIFERNYIYYFHDFKGLFSEIFFWWKLSQWLSNISISSKKKKKKKRQHRLTCFPCL